MSIPRHTLLPVVPLVIIMVLTGCRMQNWIAESAHENDDEIRDKVHQSQQIRNPLPSSQLTKSTAQSWIGHRIPIRSGDLPQSLPAELNQAIDLTYVEQVTISEVGQLIAAETGIAVNVAADIKNSMISDIDWNGPASRGLDHLMGRLGLSWRYFDNQIEIYHTKPQSWIIFTPPVIAKWQASVGLSGSVQGGVGGSTLQAQDQVVVSMDTGDFWQQLEATVAGLLSPAGKFVLNRQSGELTVIDTPQSLSKVSEWVDSKNQDLSTQVQVHVELYEIEQSESAIAGYNLLGTLQEAFGKSAADIQFGSDDKGALFGFRLTHSSEEATEQSDISLILRDAANGGRISKLTSTVVRGINGLPVPVFFGDETSYLERRDVVNDDGLTTVRLIPGKLQDGIALNMVPRVLPDTDRLMLNITVRTTRIKGISRFPTDAGPEDPVIQLPDLESRSVLLPVLLRSGETLFVAGMDTSRVSNRERTGILSEESNIENRRASLVLLITPYIIRLPNIIARITDMEWLNDKA